MKRIWAMAVALAVWGCSVDESGGSDSGSAAVDVAGDAGGDALADAQADAAACGDDDAPCDDGDACTKGEVCKAGVCAPGAAIDCDDGDVCTADACDAASGCVYTAAKAGDTPLACDDGDACTSGDHCKSGACLPTATLDCDDDNACTEDSCEPAGCVHAALSASASVTAACDDGDACTAGDACKDGACEPGAAVDCDDGDVCSDDSCDAVFGCVHAASALGKGAGCDDGDACTSGDHCEGALCVGAEALGCDDGNPCTKDACESAKGCVATPLSASAATPYPCDDGDGCTTADACKDGACAGGVPICDDANPCTTESCDKAGGCTSAANTASCDDGNACTSGEVCSAGVCTPGAAVDCDDGEPCTVDSCEPAGEGCVHKAVTDDAALGCDDGDACTHGDLCKAGACKAGAAKSCDDGKACTQDGCDAKTGACTATPLTASAGAPAPCDDGDACTKDDACAKGVCVGSAGACDDGNACTFDACDANKGCLNVATAAACDDGDACSVGDACQGGACKAGGAKNCDDGDGCTADSCDAKAGACAHKAEADGKVCDDGKLCTSGESCSAGKCVAEAKVEVRMRVTTVKDASAQLRLVGDLDGDGKPELIWIGKGQYGDAVWPRIRVLKGDGGGGFVVFKDVDHSDAASCVVGGDAPTGTLADVDGDGDLDLVLGGVTYRAQCGDTTVAPQWHIAAVWTNDSGALQGPDVVAASKTLPGSVEVVRALGVAWGTFKGGKAKQLAVFSELRAKQDEPSGEGRVFVLAPSLAGGKSTWPSVDLTNDGKLTGEDATAADGKVALLDVVDLDGDGYDDLVPLANNESWSIAGTILHNNAATPGAFKVTHASATGNKGIRGIFGVRDVDGDGNLDMLVQNLEGVDGKAVYTGAITLWRGDGSPSWWTKASLPKVEVVPPTSAASNPAAMQIFAAADDVDGDGLRDVIGAVVEDGKKAAMIVVWRHQQQSGKAPTFSRLTLSAYEPEIIFAPPTDVDGDGDIETLSIDDDSARVEVYFVDVGDCVDGNACTVDSCLQVKGCVGLPFAGGCDDGDVCWLGDMCQGALCKKGDTALDCGDDDSCTVDSCDAKQGGCVHVAVQDGSTCDDDDPCTVKDTCAAGSCAGTKLDCDDGVACTNDACDGNGCTYVPDHASCDDGVACTQDTCSSKGCAHLPTDADCPDDKPCHKPICTVANGCVGQPLADGSSCDDGDACTENTGCNQGQCQGGVAAKDNTVCGVGDSGVCYAGGCVCPDGEGKDSNGSCTTCGCSVHAQVQITAAVRENLEVYTNQPSGDRRPPSAVHIAGDRMIVGAPAYSPGGDAGVGGATIFERVAGTWQPQAAMIGPGVAKVQGGFGTAVAIDGDVAFIGQPGNGAVEAWKREASGTWVRKQVVVSTLAGPEFGSAVALCKGVLFVGHRRAATKGLKAGAVLGFVWDGNKLGGALDSTPPGVGPDDYFGDIGSIACDGDSVAMGAPGNSGTGAVWPLHHDGNVFKPSPPLKPPTGALNFSNSAFSRVAMRGQTLLVGAPNYQGGKGAVVLFNRDGNGKWAYTAVLTNPDHQGGDNIGAAVALSADARVALFGAPGRSTGGLVNSGAAELWVRTPNGYSHATTLTAAQPSKANRYGTAGAFDGDTATVVGDNGLDKDARAERWPLMHTCNQGPSCICLDGYGGATCATKN